MSRHSAAAPSSRRRARRGRSVRSRGERSTSMNHTDLGKAQLTFNVYKGDRLVQHEALSHDVVKIGSDQRSHLRVDDALASRMHAVLEVVSPTDITLIDLGSEAGSFVNGQRVNKCRLHA